MTLDRYVLSSTYLFAGVSTEGMTIKFTISWIDRTEPKHVDFIFDDTDSNERMRGHNVVFVCQESNMYEPLTNVASLFLQNRIRYNRVRRFDTGRAME